MTIKLKVLLFFFVTLVWENTNAFNLVIKSGLKLKKMQVIEHYGVLAKLVSVGSNDIALSDYPNAVYLVQPKGGGKGEFQMMIWVPADTSTIQITIKDDYSIIFENDNPYQNELNKIFQTSNTYSLFPYDPKDNQPLEPILALEAKAIIQNLEASTKPDVLKNLLNLSEQRGINNWSTDVLSNYLKPTNRLYDPLKGKLIKVVGLDSLENQVEILPTHKKPYMLAISGSWCGPCIKGLPKLKEFHDSLQDRIILVSVWNDPDLETFINNHKVEKQLITWSNLWDRFGLMANALRVESYPTYILFDPFGNELKRWNGKFTNNIEDYISDKF